MRVWRRARGSSDQGLNQAPTPAGQWPPDPSSQPPAGNSLQYYIPWTPPGAEGAPPPFESSVPPPPESSVAPPPEMHIPQSPETSTPSPFEPGAGPPPAPTAPPVAPVAVAPAAAEPAAVEPAPIASAPATPAPSGGIEMQGEFLRVLEVVTRMCDHVIEYIEADRAERKIMVDTLSQLARVIATNANAVESAASRHVPIPTVAGEQIIGGSMERGPEPVVDLREPEPVPDTRVEVRCSFGEGERWVDGFEIIDVTDGDDGPMYRLRRQRDGAILPQLFEAASIRHIETFEELGSERKGPWTKL